MDPIYKRVIEILYSRPNYEAIVWEIAKDHPDIVNKAFESCSKSPQVPNISKYSPIDWEIVACEHLVKGELVSAIKTCRSWTNWGLKEAKDAVESLRDKIKAGMVEGFVMQEEAKW